MVIKVGFKEKKWFNHQSSKNYIDKLQNKTLLVFLRAINSSHQDNIQVFTSRDIETTKVFLHYQ